MNKRDDVITIEEVTLLWPNFSGKPSKFKTNGGERTVTIRLKDPKEFDGTWLEDRIRIVPGKDPSVDEDKFVVDVKVSYKGRPPKITMVNSQGLTELDEESVGILDDLQIEFADVALNPYHWEVGGKTGVAVYLKTAYITVEEDEFEGKYSHLR